MWLKFVRMSDHEKQRAPKTGFVLRSIDIFSERVGRLLSTRSFSFPSKNQVDTRHQKQRHWNQHDQASYGSRCHGLEHVSPPSSMLRAIGIRPMIM
jgi:hypothetical protein